MPEAAAGSSASPPPLSCGEITIGSATRRGLFGLAASAALMAALPSAARTDDPALALFAEWCACHKYTCPEGWREKRKEAAYTRVGRRADAIITEMLALPPSPQRLAALLWLQAWEATGGWIDPANAALPNKGAPVARAMALAAAQSEPRLARIAGMI